MVVVDGEGVPLGSTITSASPAEVNLIEPLLDGAYGRSKIRRLIYDRAADSDPLRQRLAKRRIELICPHRRNRSLHRDHVKEVMEQSLVISHMNFGRSRCIRMGKVHNPVIYKLVAEESIAEGYGLTGIAFFDSQ